MSVGKMFFLGLTAYAIYKECTMTKKEKLDWSKRQVLSNPYLNPLGCYTHIDNENKINDLDSQLVKDIVAKYDKEYQEDYNKLTQAEKVQEYYKNGGKGLNFSNFA